MAVFIGNDQIKEIICDTCSHREVCSIKQKYLKMVNDLRMVFYNFQIIPDQFHFQDPKCTAYQKTLAVPRWNTKGFPKQDEGLWRVTLKGGVENEN